MGILMEAGMINLAYVFFILSGVLLCFVFGARFMKKKLFHKSNSSLQIEEHMYIDNKNKILVVKRDKKRYVILLGSTNLILDKENV